MLSISEHLEVCALNIYNAHQIIRVFIFTDQSEMLKFAIAFADKVD